MVESLHQCDQGIFKHMVGLIREKFGVSVEKRLESRMKVIKDKYWIGSLQLPSLGIWTSGTGIQAHEYRAVMQVSFEKQPVCKFCPICFLLKSCSDYAILIKGYD